MTSLLKKKEWEEPYNQLIIDLNAIKSNYLYIRSELPENCIFYAVLKADAYGHGIVEVGNALAETGCQHFAVDTPQEGIQLRKHGFLGEILLLNPIPEWMAEPTVYHDLSVSVVQEPILESLEEASVALDKTCKIHIAVNVGLNRLGVSPSRLISLARKISPHSCFRLEGLYGQPHDPTSADQSYRKLFNLYEKMQLEGVVPKCLHFANSATFLSHPETIASGLRLGILLYGVLPPEHFSSYTKPLPIQPAMSLSSKIVQIKKLPKGSKIGYRAKQKTSRDSIIATIPLGYAQGLDRNLSTAGKILIKGQKVPFIGAISMNNATIDITDVPDVKVGDCVTIIGKQGDSEININQLAAASGTISAELMVRFGKGIARQFISGKENNQMNLRINSGEEMQEIQIDYIQTEKELPEWITTQKIMKFLKIHLQPFGDPIDVIRSSLDFALSTDYGGKGFILIASNDRKIIGVVVAVYNETTGFIPENVLVYVCVHKEYRKMGIGTRLIREAIKRSDGGVKLHVDKSSPSVNFYRKMGFNDRYLEMRYTKGDDINE